MGNSISGSSGGGGTGNDNNRPGGSKYPLTVNSNELLDGHYVVFYTGLDVEQINKICKSMDGVATITDLTLIIANARSSKTTVSNKYLIKSIQLNESSDTPPSEQTNKDDDTNTIANDFGITIDSNYYMIISSTLLESANNVEINLLRSIDSTYAAKIYIGTTYSNFKTSYFDAYITDGFKDMLNSSNPINPIKKMRVFMELPSVPTIRFNIETLQLQYNARYSYVAVCQVTKLYDAISHITTIRNNANLMGIYYYSMSDTFVEDALKQFAFNENTIKTTFNRIYNIFSVGHSSPNVTNSTVQFMGRIINLKANVESKDFRLVMTNNNPARLEPKNISTGFLQPDTLFPFKVRGRVVEHQISDVVTQVFGLSQIIQFNRNDFQLYIGFINTRYEIDIIGTLLNGIKIPTRRFIFYIGGNDVFGDFELPSGLYKISNNGITNIPKFQNGVNLSEDYYLTLGIIESASVKDYDVVNVPGTKLNLKTLRNNHTVSKQPPLATHSGDMKTEGGYVPSSELILPSTYINDSKLVTICAVDTSPTAVWNMARILKFKYGYSNWVLNFSLLPNYKLDECTGFKIVKQNNNMILLYSDTLPVTFVNTDDSFETISKDNNTKLFKLSQSFILAPTRAQFISVFTVYPYKVTSSVNDYQQYTYLPVQNMSFKDYEIADLQMSTKDTFIGGISNVITLYASMTRFDMPTIDQGAITGRHQMYIDYFPTINSIELMNSYISVFTNFMNQGSNQQLIKYTCLMRVRKEWIKNNKPNPQYFEVIEDVNTDYALIFMFGGTESRYIYNKTTRQFSLTNYQSLYFDTSIAKSTTPKSDDVYMENPLDAVIKTSDEVRFLNGPINESWCITSAPITSYPNKDFLSLYFSPFSNTPRQLLLNGSVIQKDISYTRHTFFRDDWMYFIFNLNTINLKETPSKSKCLVFFNIYTFAETNTEMPSLTASISATIKSIENGPFATFRVIYDNTNKVYTLANLDVIISTDARYYTFNDMRMFLRSAVYPEVQTPTDGNLLLDLVDNEFKYSVNSVIYAQQSFSIRVSLASEPVPYPQVDKISTKSSGVTVDTDNAFWSSIRAFVYIDDLERFEVNNLVDVAKYLAVNLDGFFICTLVSYDSTTPESWIYDRCIIIRGNEKTPITISIKNGKYYYIYISDPKYYGNFMKFGIWNSKSTPTSTDIRDVDFIINPYIGLPYDTTMKVYQNERIGIDTGYMNFLFPADTVASFPKFINFTTSLNKYILFARPIDKLSNEATYNAGVCILKIGNSQINTELDFSEIINFVVQWRALTKNTLDRIIIQIYGTNTIKRPAKRYSITIDNLEYDTDNFTFTDDSRVIIFPKTEYDSLYARYSLNSNVFYCSSQSQLPSPIATNHVYYYGPNANNIIETKIGTASGYLKKIGRTFQHLDMTFIVTELITKQ